MMATGPTRTHLDDIYVWYGKVSGDSESNCCFKTLGRASGDLVIAVKPDEEGDAILGDSTIVMPVRISPLELCLISATTAS